MNKSVYVSEDYTKGKNVYMNKAYAEAVKEFELWKTDYTERVMEDDITRALKLMWEIADKKSLKVQERMLMLIRNIHYQGRGYE